jgi:hypothetical protein
MNMSQTDVCDLCNAEVGEDLEHVCFWLSSLRRNPSEHIVCKTQKILSKIYVI